MTKEIVVENTRGIRIAYEVVEDIGGPEKISLDRLEMVFLLEGCKNPHAHLDIHMDIDLEEDVLYRWDICDDAKKADANLGLSHARCVQRVWQELPDGWEKYFFIFPGTVVRKIESKELYVPCLMHGSIYFHLRYRQGWPLHLYRFLRWRK